MKEGELIQLQGPRVILRDVRADDLEDFWYWQVEAEDREHQRWNGPYAPVEVPSREDFDRSWEGSSRESVQRRFAAG
ncbi:hypothetical protein SAMN04488112_105158 [Melghirimyces thermohalophilus]|uniref:Acetyltransferase (GNAT) domain-containing protein n=1 Tax=Melghirimyces thermohalophilus TaxID=1236220 RepID=A0A1G6KB35_9BACL|nr:hypothetical protein SAMN04488112_105158 [Melghirimyces thermohalophilus]